MSRPITSYRMLIVVVALRIGVADGRVAFSWDVTSAVCPAIAVKVGVN